MTHPSLLLLCSFFLTIRSLAAGGNDSLERTYLVLGDSYSIGTAVKEKERFPAQALSMLGADGYHFQEADILAANGWTTADLWNAVQNKKADRPYDIITLLIGVNNQYREGSAKTYRKEFTAILKKAIDLAGDHPERVIVLSIPDYSVTPFASRMNASRIASRIDLFNSINRSVSDAFHTKYLSVTEESRKAGTNATLIASDGLHFSGEEYGIWASALKNLIERVIDP